MKTTTALGPTTRKHLILSLLLSLALTFTLGMMYLIYPFLMAMVVPEVGHVRGGSGTSSVVGGAHFNRVFVLSRASLIMFFLLISPGLFVFCFLVFQRMRLQRRPK